MVHSQKNVPRFNVVMAGARDFYEVPLALDEAGQLGCLITDFYTPDRLRSLLKVRYHHRLSSRKTLSIWPAALIGKLIPLGSRWRSLVDYFLGFSAALITYLGPNRAIVYSYYIQGFVGFYRLIGRRPDVLICFQVHPTPWFANQIIEDDAKTFNRIRPINFTKETEQQYSETKIGAYISALNTCDLFVCASSITARSIHHPLLVPSRSVVIPYGSRHSDHARRLSVHWHGDNKTRLLTVSQVTQRKGLHWAFEAMSRLAPGLQDRFDWLVVSSRRDEQIVGLAPPNVRFLPKLPDGELADLIGSADLFVMPSLIEGFGLVYIEALSMGTPIVYTANTGADDFCIDSVHGFRVEPSSLDPLINLFKSHSETPIRLRSMRKSCVALASTITWNRFREGVRLAVMSTGTVRNTDIL